MYYPFSLVQNDGHLFPDLPAGVVAVFGEHQKAFAKADYDGNLNIPNPKTKDDALEQWVYLSKDFDSIHAWHGQRRKDKHNRLVLINWRRALEKQQMDDFSPQN